MSIEHIWLLVGFLGQGIFLLRFLVQWLLQGKGKRSMVSEIFWYLSALGSTMLLVYAVAERDPVFILGQFTLALIYSRNLILVNRERLSRAQNSNLSEVQ
jgi:lipid-A-disaccharide synthase-like uncharacterized protein